MAKRMLIDTAHPEETRVVVLNGQRLEEFDFETSTKKQIKGNIYLAKITRVEPSLQAAFVEYGGNRHGFLAFNEIHPDYYRIPMADRRAAHASQEEMEGELSGIAQPAFLAESAVDHHADSSGFEPDGAAPSEDDGMAYPSEPFYSHDGDGAGAFEGESRESVGHGGEHLHEAEHHHDGDEPESGELQPDNEHAMPSEGDAGGDDIIETLGGDEIEESARQRSRQMRHYKIQEVIKRRQILLVQVTKEERGNKGAALTTYLSLAGRYCVLMPNTARGGGVSRKITNTVDRRRLKDLMSDLDVPEGMGVIVRTAGSERSKVEIKRDFEYLLRLWDDIRDLTLKSTAPALIYEEGNLIKRSIRDLYTRDIEEVIVDGEEGYRTAKAFMKMLMPSHAKRIKPYRDPTVGLLQRYQVESQIDAIHSPIVQLRSGGYIVINPTEALVAIDVNSGRSTRERNIEETALKTNVEAAEEIARQLRLRDLAGLIVIDFIDMEESRNQATVERRLKEAMRTDRARIQLGRISPFGLLELSRQRLRPSLLEASTQPCPHCNGTGHIRSTESTALHVLRAIEEEGTRRRSAEISVAVPTAVALYILNQKRDALAHAEARYGFRVMIGSDDTLVPPAFRLERLRAFTSAEVAALPPPVMMQIAEPEEEERIEEEEEEEALAETAEAEAAENEETRPEGEDGHGRRRRRRRRRRRGDEERGGEEGGEAQPALQEARDLVDQPDMEEAGEEAGDHETEDAPEAGGEMDASEGGGRKRRRRGRRGGRRRRREPGQEGMRPDGEEAPVLPLESFGTAAEAVELIPPTPMNEENGEETAEPLAAAPLPAELPVGAEAVPVIEHGDTDAELTPPEPAAPTSPPATESRPHEQHNVPPPHDITGPVQNPKRGWWRRMMDS